MDRWLLLAATLLAAFGGAWGMRSVHHGRRCRWTIIWMMGAFVCQLGFLSVRGEMRGACPLGDRGEILAFLAWSLTAFYLIVGRPYRISLLGVFTTPVVVTFQAIALIPGMLTNHPPRNKTVEMWGELHSATSVLSYGALALAAIAAVMFLVLDHQLKEHHLKSGLFRNLPPARELLKALVRLLWIGLALLTIGIVAGFLMPRTSGGWGHFIAALVTWIGYAVLLAIVTKRGLTGRRLSLFTVMWFLASLTVFAFV